MPRLGPPDTGTAGPTGIGKSTLALLTADVIRPSHGHVLLGGQSLDALGEHGSLAARSPLYADLTGHWNAGGREPVPRARTS